MNTQKITNKIVEVFDTLADEFNVIHNLNNNYSSNNKMEVTKATTMCLLAKQLINAADILVRSDRLAIDGKQITMKKDVIESKQ